MLNCERAKKPIHTICTGMYRSYSTFNTGMYRSYSTYNTDMYRSYSTFNMLCTMLLKQY